MTRFSETTLFLDIETHSITERYAKTPREYFVLGGYSWGESPEVTLTSDYDELMVEIDKATVVVGHNIHQFDLAVLFGVDSDIPLSMARQKKVFCSFIHATLANPPPQGYYTGREGKQVKCKKPAEYKKWLSLDNQAFQLGVEGKSASVSAIADRYAFTEEIQYSEKTGKELKKRKKVPIPGRCCGFGFIDINDQEFRDYLTQDVLCAREVARGLIDRHPMNAYAWRAQLRAAIDAQVSKNGIRLNVETATRRVRDMAEITAYGLDELHTKFDLPLHGKKPLATKLGKEALLKALASVGVKEMALDRTDTGAPSFSGDSIKKACGWIEADEGWARPTEGEINDAALDLADLVATLAGQRSLPELALASIYEDGFAHPSILPLQRSGRVSTTEPGLTIWDDSHKDYWEADNEDEILIEFDFSNADQRIVAALSGDRKYAIRFEEGQDGHLINAQAAWGKDVVGTDKHNPVTAMYRQKAKPGGHAWGYRVGVKKLAATLNISLEEAKNFLGALNKEFSGVVAWQDRVVARAQRDGYIVNDWGRRMPITGRAYTQGPALEGQSGTNEILTDGLFMLPNRLIRMIKIEIHDALLFSIPKASLDRDARLVVACLSKTWKPRHGGQTIEFTVGHGEPGKTWKDAVH